VAGVVAPAAWRTRGHRPHRPKPPRLAAHPARPAGSRVGLANRIRAARRSELTDGPHGERWAGRERLPGSGCYVQVVRAAPVRGISRSWSGCRPDNLVGKVGSWAGRASATWIGARSHTLADGLGVRFSGCSHCGQARRASFDRRTNRITWWWRCSGGTGSTRSLAGVGWARCPRPALARWPCSRASR
jgi:hypothetical protein